jgi:hypothetical protein
LALTIKVSQPGKREVAMARRIFPRIWLAACLAAVPGLACAQAASSPQGASTMQPARGQLLYETHCIACHNTQMHWRDRRLATSWPRLVALVDHWQRRELLNWSWDDVIEVSRHLNDTVYRLQRPSEIGAVPSAPRLVARPPAAPG